MDRERFDTLTRLVAAKGSRRLALAGLLGVVLLGRGAQPTAAQCRSKEGKEKRQCRRRHREDNAPGGIFPCQDKLLGVCTAEPIGSGCCNGMECYPTITGVVTACQFQCNTDADCKRKFPHKAFVCRQDVLVCPGANITCCLPRL